VRFTFVVILFIFLLSNQKVFLAAADSYYAESIQLMLDIDPSMNCRATVMFSFSGLSRPLNLYDFQNEPSFIGLGINAQYFTEIESTSVTVELNESKVNANQGRLIADTMIHKLEQSFEIPTLLYTESTTYSPGVLYYSYETEFPAIELRNIFLESLPSQGFTQVLASMLVNNNNYTMTISLGKEGGWSIQLWLNGETEKLVPDQEQIISLKEITGYSGKIASAPASSSSTLRIDISNQISREYEVVVNPVSPTQIRQGHREQMPQYWLDYDVTGSSVEDFSISLKIVFSRIVPIVLIVIAQITTIIISIIIINRHKKFAP